MLAPRRRRAEFELAQLVAMIVAALLLGWFAFSLPPFPYQ